MAEESVLKMNGAGNDESYTFVDDSRCKNNNEPVISSHGPVISEFLGSTQDVINIDIDEEIQIYNEKCHGVNNEDRQESLSFSKHKIEVTNNFNESNIGGNYSVKTRTDNTLESDFIDFKYFISKELATIRDNIEHLEATVNTDFEKTYLKNENIKLANEVNELRSFVGEILKYVCHNGKDNPTLNINKNLEINKNQRQNQSTGKKKIKNSFETRNVSNTDNELHKWLIPKRTLPVKKFESIQKQTTLKNRYQDLSINDVNDSVEDTRENCFNELQKSNKNNVTTHRKPSVVVNELQDNDHGYQWKHSVPGTALYSEVTSGKQNNRRIQIFSDSILKPINTRSFNHMCKSGRTYLRSFPGSTDRQRKYYAVPTLEESHPDTVIIHVGTNDLLKNKEVNRKDEIEKIAKDVIDIGLLMEEHQVQNIMISGITYSTKINVNTIRKLNDQLKIYCESHGFIYISNDSISKEHLARDGIHINQSGILKIVNNFVNVLDNYFLWRGTRHIEVM